MTVEEAMLERILAISAVAALVSTRAYPLLLPQHPELPAIRVQLVNAGRSYHLRGQTNHGNDLLQVDSYAERRSGTDPFADASDLADAIQGDWNPNDPPSAEAPGLSGWRGRAGGSPPTYQIDGVFFVNRRSMFEPNEFRLVRISTDYRVIWKRIG